MNRQPGTFSLPLLTGLGASLILHALVLWGAPEKAPQAPPPRPALMATLKAPLPELPPPLPELKLDAPETKPEPPAPKPRPTPPKPPKAAPSPPSPLGTLPPEASKAARQQLARLAEDTAFYPLEAIHQGWQGVALVQIFLDRQGHVIAARIDRSSGYPILDQAALRAARALRSLPASGLEEAVIPIRFRLE